ncbi:hypothetical protein GGG16DRAFT_111693 [Schizophyllum commune]
MALELFNTTRPRTLPRQDRLSPSLLSPFVDIKIINYLHQVSPAFVKDLELPFGPLKSYIDGGTFTPCGKGPMFAATGSPFLQDPLFRCQGSLSSSRQPDATRNAGLQYLNASTRGLKNFCAAH